MSNSGRHDWIGNTKSVFSPLGASSHSSLDREKDDFYATSPVAAERLLEIEPLAGRIWECACGEGHLAIPLIMGGHEVRCTDLVDRGYGEGGVDFLSTSEAWDGDIVTNPPYRFADRFVEHAIETVADGRKVCMFLKLTFLEGKKRQALFRKWPPARVWVSSDRISCARNGNFTRSAVAYAWYVWVKGWKGDTVVKWF